MYKNLVAAVRNPVSLAERAINASLWNIASMAIMYPLRLAGNLIMTWILAPEAFGLMATVLTLQIGLAMFSDIGILQSVMRDQRGDTPRFLRVAWAVQILRSAIIVAILVAIGFGVYFLGPVIAGPDTVYADPHLPWLIWLSTISAVCLGLESTCNLLAQRRMNLRPGTITEVISQLSAFVVMVGLGLVIQSVWALMAGMIAASIARLVLTHMIFPGPRMRLTWDRNQVLEMWIFGRWLILSSLGGFLTNYGDRLIFSALFDKRVFGVFAIAVLWVELATTVVYRIGSSTLLPSISETIYKKGNIKAVLRKCNNAFFIFSAGLFLATVFSAVLIFNILYTKEYSAGILYMQLLAAKILVYGFMPVQQYLVARGHSRYFAFAVLSNGLMIVTICYVGFFSLGVEGAIIGSIIGGIISPFMCSVHRDVVRQVDVLKQMLAVAAIPAACLAVWLVVAPGTP